MTNVTVQLVTDMADVQPLSRQINYRNHSRVVQARFCARIPPALIIVWTMISWYFLVLFCSLISAVNKMDFCI
jgi:hypothetical protein